MEATTTTKICNKLKRTASFSVFSLKQRLIGSIYFACFFDGSIYAPNQHKIPLYTVKKFATQFESKKNKNKKKEENKFNFLRPKKSSDLTLTIRLNYQNVLQFFGMNLKKKLINKVHPSKGNSINHRRKANHKRKQRLIRKVSKAFLQKRRKKTVQKKPFFFENII